LAFLQKEFPQLTFIPFEDYKIRYQKKGSLTFKMLLSIPLIIKGIYKEHRRLQQIIDDFKIDAVISDNRYGLFTRKIPCVFMTHQLFIKIPAYLRFTSPLARCVTRFFINRYDECWIPDFEGAENLSGELSHGRTTGKNTFYIGSLSRFGSGENGLDAEYSYDLLVMLSGPEPQRRILEEKVFDQLKTSDLKTIVVQGITDKEIVFDLNPKVKVYSHLETRLLQKFMTESKIILCRSGYSTIMDLAALGKKAIFIPTPGQTEQEYLAKYHLENQHFYSIAQKNLSIPKAIAQAAGFQGIELKPDFDLLKHRLAILTT